MEIWKDVVGYEGKYEVSSYGRVKSLSRNVNFAKHKRHVEEKILKLTPRSKVLKYPCVWIDGKTIFVHRLVATAFIPNPLNKSQINHIDCDPTNNIIDNLEWVTQAENTQHAWDNNLISMSNTVFKKGEPNKQRKLDELQIRVIRDLQNTGVTHKRIGLYFNVSRPVITSIMRGYSYKETI